MSNQSAPSLQSQSGYTTARDGSLMALYLVTSVVAMLGNLFVCRTIIRKRRLNSTTYALIFNMAVSDIIGGFVIPAQWLFCSTFVLDATFLCNSCMCWLMKTLQVLSYYVSSLTMTAIAYDRYRLVVKPMAGRVNVTCVLVVVWTLGILFISGNLFVMRVSEYFSPTKGLVTCRMIFTQWNLGIMYRKVRATILIVTQYIIPLGLTAIFYTLVMRRIWSRENMSGTTSDTKRQAFDEKKKQTIKMLIMVTVLFGLSYLPAHTYHFLMFYTKVIPTQKNTCYSTTFYMLCYWLCISSIAYNPFIYCYFNAEFKREALRYWHIVSCKSAQTVEVSENSGLGVSTTETSTIAEKPIDGPETGEHKDEPSQQLKTTPI